MSHRLPALVLPVVVLALVSACGGSGTVGLATTPPTPSTTTTSPITPASPTATTQPPGIEFVQSGGCGDAFFWAADADATVALLVSVDAVDRSTSEPTVIDFSVPDPQVTVEVQRGSFLTEAFCNDVLQNHRLDETVLLVAGAGSMTLAPAGERFGDCGKVGRLRFDGGVTDDGTVVEPIDIRTNQIGCYAG